MCRHGTFLQADAHFTTQGILSESAMEKIQVSPFTMSAVVPLALPYFTPITVASGAAPQYPYFLSDPTAMPPSLFPCESSPRPKTVSFVNLLLHADSARTEPVPADIRRVGLVPEAHKPRVAQRIQKLGMMRVELRVQDAEQDALPVKMLGKTAGRIALHFVDMRKLARRIQAWKTGAFLCSTERIPGIAVRLGRGMLASFEGYGHH